MIPHAFFDFDPSHTPPPHPDGGGQNVFAFVAAVRQFRSKSRIKFFLKTWTQ